MIFYGCARGCCHRYEFARLMNDHIMFDLIRCPSGFTQKAALKIINRMDWFRITNGGIHLLRAPTMIRLMISLQRPQYTPQYPPWDASQDNRHV